MLDRLSAAGRELGRGLLQLLYPGYCLLCGQALSAERARLCESCEGALLTDPLPSCPRCAGTVGPYAVREGRCAACREESLPFDSALRLGVYEGVLRQGVLRLKHHAGEGLAELLGERWAEKDGARFRALGPEVVVPVPLHWWRRLQRGYNQSAAVAWGLASGLGLPCQRWALRRTRHTPPQTGQSATARRDNVRGAFRARSWAPVRGRCVLLVDDVMTTGATVGEAARALKEAGAARVVVAVLARA